MRRNGGGRLRLSILDHTPVSSGSTLGDAFWHSTKLAELAEQVGYERYWVAEHHNMPWLASSSPAVLVAHVAARTTKLPEPRSCASAPVASSSSRAQEQFVSEVFSSHIVGSPSTVEAGLHALAHRTRADEIMIATIMHGYTDRLRSYELIAQACLTGT